MTDHKTMRNVVTEEGFATVDRGWIFPRRISVGENQGRGDPLLSRTPEDEAIAAARMGGGLHDEEPEEGPGLALSRFAWLIGCLCLGLWGAVLAFLAVNGWL